MGDFGRLRDEAQEGMRAGVAVIADIHGNLPALLAVLAEIDALGVNDIICCGDIVSGPLPSETADVVMSLGSRFVSVRGNADRGAVEAFDGVADPNETHEDDIWAGQQLSRAQRDYLAAMPLTFSAVVSGVGSVLACHGTPRSDSEIVLEISDASRLRKILQPVREATIVCGNTHMPFDRHVGQQRLINPGSVGWPYGAFGAHWVLLGPTVEFRRTCYDHEAAAAELRRTSRWPRLETFIEQVLYKPLPKDTALEFFARLEQGT